MTEKQKEFKNMKQKLTASQKIAKKITDLIVEMSDRKTKIDSLNEDLVRQMKRDKVQNVKVKDRRNIYHSYYLEKLEKLKHQKLN